MEGARDTTKYRILLVEDDPGDQVLLSHALGGDTECVDVVVVQTESEFERSLRAMQFECVLFDFHLFGGCRATDLLPILLAIQPDCPAIVVSGSDAQSVVVASMRSGSVDFIHKDDAIVQSRLWARIGIAIRAAKKRVALRETDRRRTHRAIRDAQTDALTGLANRRVVERYMNQVASSVHGADDVVSMAMLDIDHFKSINDRYGHSSGDSVLVSVARRLRLLAPSDAIVARWGGEEFVVILPNLNRQAAVHWAETTRQLIRDDVVHCDGRELRATVSIGLCTQAAMEMTTASIELADSAMYAAKRSGRDCTRTWTAAWSATRKSGRNLSCPGRTPLPLPTGVAPSSISSAT